MAPNSYIIGPSDSVETITEKILVETDKLLSPYKNTKFKNGYSLHQILSLASVVERETIKKEDKYLVSGVFYNRIKEGMMLQSDITVLYALQKHSEYVSYKDLKVNSPYNTYLHYAQF